MNQTEYEKIFVDFKRKLDLAKEACLEAQEALNEARRANSECFKTILKAIEIDLAHLSPKGTPERGVAND